MESKSHVMIIAVLFFCFSLQFPSQTAAVLPSLEAPPLVMRMCKSAHDVSFKFCIYSMLRNPGTKGAKNMVELAQAALNTAKAETLGVRDFFNHSTDPGTKGCSDAFDSALKCYDLRGLQDGMATYDVHVAYDSMTRCKDQLESSKVNDPVVTKKMKHWTKVYLVAYAAVSEAEKDAAKNSEG